MKLPHNKFLLNNALNFNLQLEIENRILKDVPKINPDQIDSEDGSIEL